MRVTAMVLGDLGRQDEALTVLSEMITRFEADETPTIQEIVSEAREAREEMVDGESE
jgi:hypothetical protein